ncbi:MAG: hypothetical protein HUJ86_06560 [Synergistes sp.]|nr:hypothetical protein [Synergistes sp.]
MGIKDNLEKYFKDNASFKKITNGDIKSETKMITDSDEAWRLLRAFGGEGWVCSTGSPDITEFSPEDPIPETMCGLILTAEAANKECSLHINRAGSELAVTTLRRVPAGEDEALIVCGKFIDRRGGALLYETAWRVRRSGEGDGMIEEYRPCAYRFAGFDERKERE